MTTTFPEKTDLTLNEEREDWQRQINDREDTISAQTHAIDDLEEQLAKCRDGESDRVKLSAIQVFPHREDFPLYVDYPKVFDALDELGIKRVRGQLGPGTSAKAFGFYQTAYEDHGIKTFFTIGEPREPMTASQLSAIETRLATLGDAVDSIYGWNEPNHIRGGGPAPLSWIAQTVEHQKALGAMGGRLGKPVGTAQLWSGTVSDQWNDMAKLRNGGMSKADYDIIAYHLYPRDNDTAAEVAAFYGKTELELRRVLGDTDSPFACTEYGWSTAPKAGTSGSVRLTEAQRAERLPMVAQYHTDNGNRHSLFELMNTADSTGADREDWLGIVHVDGTRTPAFAAYRAFLAGP